MLVKWTLDSKSLGNQLWILKETPFYCKDSTGVGVGAQIRKTYEKIAGHRVLKHNYI